MVKKSVADNSDDRVNLGRDIVTPVVKAEESTSLKEEAPKKKRVSMVEENIQPTKRWRLIHQGEKANTQPSLGAYREATYELEMVEPKETKEEHVVEPARLDSNRILTCLMEP